MNNRWMQLAFVLLVTTVAYLPIFRNGFVIDDHVFIGKYHPSIAEAFRGAVPLGHEGVYRPVRGVIYTVYYNLFGANPFFYHLHSLLVHLAATVLVFLIIREIGGRGKIGLIGGLLFGLHPIHTESITYIAASMEMTGVVFFFAAFLAYLKGKRIVAMILALLAFFTYEMTITLPLLLVLYECIVGSQKVHKVESQKSKLLRTWPYWVGVGVYLFVRFVIMGIAGRSTYPGGSVFYTILTLPKVLVHYLWVTVWPLNLMNNHIISPGIEAFVYRGYRTAAILGQSILDPEILLAIGVIGGIGVIGWKMRKTHPLVSFGIAWFFVSLLPVMGFVPGGSMFNEKMLYISSVGFVMVVAWFLGRSGKLGKLGMIGVIGVIVLLYGLRTAIRNADWHDDVTLWQKDVAAAPTQNAYANFALGNAYNDRKDYAKALEAYLGSVTINPGFAVGYASLSRTYRDMGNTELSNVYYQKAAAAEPGFWQRP